jgi:GNAT superfamily N-acetyltransferase
VSQVKDRASALKWSPLTLNNWPEFEALFGQNGAYGGCWCMWWRLKRKEFEENQNEGNRRAMLGLVESGEVPGILAYLDGEPVGWCSIAPREQFGALNRSPSLKRIDDEPVWSLVCFFVAREWREKGIARGLISCAIEYVKERGGRTVEAYPTTREGKALPPVSSFMGTRSLFEQAGFKEVSRGSGSKILVRYKIR